MNAIGLQGLYDLLGSERGVFALALAICSSAFVFTDRMTIQQWVDFNQWIGGVLIGSKTITTGLEIMKRPSSAAPTVPPAVPPVAPATATVTATVAATP